MAIAAASQSPAQRLQEEKLRAEISKLRAEADKLKAEADNQKGLDGVVAVWGPSGAGIAALLVAGVAIFTFKRQRGLDREQRDWELHRNFDDRLSNVIGDFASAKSEAAAIWLITFAGPDYKKFHRQVRLVTLATLKGEQANTVKQRLVQAWKTTLQSGAELQEDERDFSDVMVTDADFKGVTGLQRANFKAAQLIGAQFQDADLQEAHFEGATLTRAEFVRANLRAAHFGGAHLQQTSWKEAALVETDLTDAHLDTADLRAILEAEDGAANARFSEQDGDWLNEERRKMTGDDVVRPEERAT